MSTIGRATPITLGSKDYVVGRDERGLTMFEVVNEPSNPDDLNPFRTVVPFGAWGVGSHLPAVRHQCSYAENCTIDEWGELKPGPLLTKAGLSATNAITKIVTAKAGRSTTSAYTAATVADNSAVGSLSWAATSGTLQAAVATDDTTYARATYSGNETSHYLKCTNFGFDMGASAASDYITNITLTVIAKIAGTGTNTAPKIEARLVNAAGSVVTPPATVQTSALTTSESTSTLGSTTGSAVGLLGYWGTLLTTADVEDSDFGVVLRVTSLGSNASGNETISIESVSLSVTANNTYTDSGAPGTVADDNSVGSDTWTASDAGTLLNAVTSNDNVYAQVTLTQDTTTHYLKCTAFNTTGFGVASGAQVVGVTLKVSASTSSTAIPTLKAALVVGDVVQSSSTKSSAALTSSVAEIGFGSTQDTWGQTLTAANVNTTTFGVVIWAEGDGSTSGNVDIDLVTMTVTAGTSGDQLVYAAAKDKLYKLRMEVVGTTITTSLLDTKTFTHGEGGQTPVISDMVVLRDGNTSVKGCILIGFGETAQVQQIDTISPSGADTYGSLSGNKAFAKVFGLALGPTNVTQQVWKSVGKSESTIPFSKIQSMDVDDTDRDYTNLQNWTPRSDTGTPYHVGNYSTAVSALGEYQRGLVVGKPEGAYAFDVNYTAYNFASTRGYADDLNFTAMTTWGRDLVYTTAQDLKEYPGGDDDTVGPSTLTSQDPIYQAERCVGMTTFGRWLYAIFDRSDTTSSSRYVLYKAKRRVNEQVPHPYLWYPVANLGTGTFNSVRQTLSGISTVPLGSGVTILMVSFFNEASSASSAPYDVAFIALGPRGYLKYTGSSSLPNNELCNWRSTVIGSPDKRMVLEKLTVFAKNCSATKSFVPNLYWDGTFSETLTSITSNGRQELTPTAPSTGYMLQLVLQISSDSSTLPPTLVDFSGSADAGGIAVEGQMQPDTVDRFTMTIVAGEEGQDGGGGFIKEDPFQQFTNLKALESSTTTMVNERYWGDTTARTVLIQSVSFKDGVVDEKSPRNTPAQRYITIRGRLLQS